MKKKYGNVTDAVELRAVFPLWEIIYLMGNLLTYANLVFRIINFVKFVVKYRILAMFLELLTGADGKEQKNIYVRNIIEIE